MLPVPFIYKQTGTDILLLSLNASIKINKQIEKVKNAYLDI